MKRALLALVILCSACADIEEELQKRRDAGMSGTGGGNGTTDAGSDGGFIPPPGGPICLDGFCWENPLPQGNQLNAIWAPDPNEDVFMVGEVGTMLRWKAGAWYSYQSNFLQGVSLNSIWGAGNKLWVVGSSELPGTSMPPKRFELPNGPWVAENWTGPLLPQLLSIRGTSEDDVWAVGYSGTLGHRGDAGWQSWSLFGGNPNLTAIAFDSNGQCKLALRYGAAGVAPCDGGALEFTLDDNADEVGLNSLWSPAPGQFYASGRSNPPDIGRVWSNVDGGWGVVYSGENDCSAGAGKGALNFAACSSFVVRTLPDGNAQSSGLNTSEQFVGAWTGGTLEGSWLVGQGGVVFRHNGGQWFPLHGGSREPVFTLFVDAQGNAYAAGSNYAFWTRQPDSTWQMRSLPSEGSTTNAIWVAPDGSWRAYAGSSHVLYEGDAFNGSMAQAAGVGIIAAAQFNALWGNSRDDLLAVGNAGEVWHRTDAGWNQKLLFPDGGTPNLAGIDGRPDGTAFIVGAACQVLVRERDGGWHPEVSQSVNCDGDLAGVWAVPPNGVNLEAVAVGPKQSIAMRANGQWSTSPNSTGNNLTSVWGASATQIYAVGDRGTLLVFNGTGWARTETGTTNDLTSVRGRVLGDGGVELFLAGAFGTILRKQF